MSWCSPIFDFMIQLINEVECRYIFFDIKAPKVVHVKALWNMETIWLQIFLFNCTCENHQAFQRRSPWFPLRLLYLKAVERHRRWLLWPRRRPLTQTVARNKLLCRQFWVLRTRGIQQVGSRWLRPWNGVCTPSALFESPFLVDRGERKSEGEYNQNSDDCNLPGRRYGVLMSKSM